MKRTNLALVKTRAATVQVQARPEGKDSRGNVVLSQAMIDRLPDGYVPVYKTQLFGKIATGQLQGRSWWAKLRGRL